MWGGMSKFLASQGGDSPHPPSWENPVLEIKIFFAQPWWAAFERIFLEILLPFEHPFFHYCSGL